MEKNKLTKITAFKLQQPYSPNKFLTLWYINYERITESFNMQQNCTAHFLDLFTLPQPQKNNMGANFFPWIWKYAGLQTFVSDSPYNEKHLNMLLRIYVNLCTVQFIYIFFIITSSFFVKSNISIVILSHAFHFVWGKKASNLVYV